MNLPEGWGYAPGDNDVASLGVSVTSSLAWLDTSADEQDSMREVLRLFTQPESRDELGIGQVRDVISNALFPGTSVIQTRARYFLIVPWCYQRGGSKHGNYERQVVETLRSQHSGTQGIIGARAGAGLRTLPSSIYWSGLTRLGILNDVTAIPGEATAQVSRSEGVDEVAERAAQVWHRGLPPAPEGFPHKLPGGLNLTQSEAEWLRERILQTATDTLLCQLVSNAHTPSVDSRFPWEDAAVHSVATSENRQSLLQAELLSMLARTASALYNVMVAEAYRTAGYTKNATLEIHQERLVDAGDRVEALRDQVLAWDQEAFWTFVRRQNPRVTVTTEAFIRDWREIMALGRSGLESPEARTVVRRREDRVKGSQSRFRNKKLLSMWGGYSGGALDFRWQLVKRLVTDIHEGLANGAAA